MRDPESIKKLSPEAQKIIELVGDVPEGEKSSKVEAAIRAHPELISGLDEYIRWREETASSVAKTDTAKAVTHPLKRAVALASKTTGEK